MGVISAFSSQSSILSNYFLVYVHVLVRNFLHHIVDHLLELGCPHGVELVQFLVTRDAVGCQLRDEILRCFGVFLGLYSLRFCSRLPVLLALVSSRLRLLDRCEQVRRRENLVEVLELLARLYFV